MYKIMSITAASLALCAVANIAQADGNNWANYRGVERSSPHDHSPPRAYHPDHVGPRYWGNQYPHQSGYYEFRYTPSTQYEYRYQRRFLVGEQIPVQYRNEYYYLHDWHSHHLYEPPHGHVWMVIDGQYLLVTTPNFTISVVVH